MPNISFEWHIHDVNIGQAWGAVKKSMPSDAAASAFRESRGVYIINTLAPFGINYPKLTSNVIYIGKGNPWTRLNSTHTKWMSRLNEALGLRFSIKFGLPRVKNSPKAYSHVESDLIDTFYSHAGAIPLLNKATPRPSRYYGYDSKVMLPIYANISEKYLAGIDIYLYNVLRADQIPKS